MLAFSLRYAMTQPMRKALEYSQDHRPQFVERLGEWLTIPSVSTQADHRADMERAATWIADDLRGLGLGGVQLFPPASHPIVYAESLEAGLEAPTVLLYGHYDVQPAEPFNLWDSEPFKPTVRGEDLYARGACDMKGQIFSIVCALESILAPNERLHLPTFYKGIETLIRFFYKLAEVTVPPRPSPEEAGP